MLLLLLLYVFLSLVSILICIPLILGKIKPNPWYGFRVRKTLQDPQTWYLANAFFARRLLAASLVFIEAALGLYCLPGIRVDAYALLCALIFAVLFSVVMLASFRYLRAL